MEIDIQDLELMDLANSIPINVFDEIDIVSNAPIEFVKEVAIIESKTDLEERANEALRHLTSLHEDYPEHAFMQISYNRLGAYLSDPNAVPIRTWRILYLIERSIKPRNSKWTWVQRLKLFYNTYLEEHCLVWKNYKDSKFYFLDKSGDHENLHAGRGLFGPDFYYYDDSIDGTTYQKMVKVEMKYAYGDLEAEVEKYKPENRNHTYGAKHVILYKEGKGFYMVDYTVDPPNVEKLENVEEPNELLQISLI